MAVMTVPTLPDWFRDTITVLRAGERTDRYGDTATADWDAATERDVTGCKVNPAAGGPEQVGTLADRDALTRRWIVAAPVDADLRSTDRVRWDGAVYDIAGEVLRWRSPFGTVDHLYAELVRVEG